MMIIMISTRMLALYIAFNFESLISGLFEGNVK